MREPFCMGMEEHMVQVSREKEKRKEKKRRKEGEKCRRFHLIALMSVIRILGSASSAAHQHNYAMKDDRGYY